MIMEEDIVKENPNRIAVTIHPFLFRQNIKIYHNGEVTHTEQVPFNEVPATIERLSNEYVVNDVDIAGAPAFTKKVKDKLFNSTTFNRSLKINLY